MSRESALKIFNVLSIIAGIITISIGVSSIPQKVTNDGDMYIGTAEEYNADLYKAQIGSRGFRIAMIGVVMFGVGLIGILCVALYYKKEYIVSSLRHVRISPEPTVIEIPRIEKNDANTNTNNNVNTNNIYKWTKIFKNFFQ